MKILSILKPIATFFAWQYRLVDDLRPDDTPGQVCALFVLLILFELVIVGLTVWLYSGDVVTLLKWLEYDGGPE